MTMEPGTVYGNRYTLDELIAVGGMGEVWKATDKVLGRTVAIKLLSANLATQPGFEERFREEARHTALLSHPNIATVYDYGPNLEDVVAEYLTTHNPYTPYTDGRITDATPAGYVSPKKYGQPVRRPPASGGDGVSV